MLLWQLYERRLLCRLGLQLPDLLGLLRHHGVPSGDLRQPPSSRALPQPGARAGAHRAYPVSNPRACAGACARACCHPAVSLAHRQPFSHALSSQPQPLPSASRPNPDHRNHHCSPQSSSSAPVGVIAGVVAAVVVVAAVAAAAFLFLRARGAQAQKGSGQFDVVPSGMGGPTGAPAWGGGGVPAYPPAAGMASMPAASTARYSSAGVASAPPTTYTRV